MNRESPQKTPQAHNSTRKLERFSNWMGLQGENDTHEFVDAPFAWYSGSLWHIGPAKISGSSVRIRAQSIPNSTVVSISHMYRMGGVGLRHHARLQLKYQAIRFWTVSHFALCLVLDQCTSDLRFQNRSTLLRPDLPRLRRQRILLALELELHLGEQLSAQILQLVSCQGSHAKWRRVLI